MDLVRNVVEGAGPADRLLLLVHGRGADEADLEGLVPYLDPEGRFVAVLPRAPLSCPPGFEWFEIGAGFPRVGADSFLPSLAALDDLVEECCKERGLDRGSAVLAGFSQGAAMVLALALSPTATPPAGVLAMSGFLPEVEGLPLRTDGAPPALVQHGTHDPLVPVRQARKAAGELERRGAPVVYREYPMAHQVSAPSADDARQWLAAVVAGERPSTPPPEAGEEASPVAADGRVREVDTAAFDGEVLTSPVPVIVDFWAPWCAPCRSVAPVLQQMAEMRRGSYAVVKVNIDEEPVLAQRYDVRSIPMVALFRNGRLERSSMGAKPRQSLEAELGMLVIP